MTELEKLELEKTDLLATMENIHQLDDKCKTDPDYKFAVQEVPKMQMIERFRMQLIDVEKKIKIFKGI